MEPLKKFSQPYGLPKENFLKGNIPFPEKNKTEVNFDIFSKILRKVSRISKLSHGQTFWFFMVNLDSLRFFR